MDLRGSGDGELLAATRSRPDAFVAFYDRYETAVVGYFTRRTGDPEVAADLTAEVFAAALGAAHRYRPEAPTAAGWLFMIAHNTLAKSLRRGRVEASARHRIGISEAVSFAGDELERVESAASTDGWVMELLEQLPAEQRQAVRARILEERSYPDIAGELETSELVVRKRVSRGLSTLRAEMEKAVMTLLPEVRSQLYAAAERRSRSPRTRLLSRVPGPRLSGRWRRAPLISLGVGLVLVGCAFGAGLIQLGAPAKTTPIFSNPRAELGALVPGTVRLLPVTTPDPQGGPRWGMRVLSTNRGVGCIQVGRLVDGKLGALGQDGAFGDDGRFHELPVSSSFDQFACAALDGKGRIFNNVTVGDQPASAAWFFGSSTGCVPPGTTPASNPHNNKTCAQSDERNLYYGLLGPAAKSITYVIGGHRRTVATAGADGAYLLVTKAPVHQLFDFPGGGTTDVVPVDGPITELHYRNGATCHLTSRSWIGGKSACTPSLEVPVGYASVANAPTRAQVATPLRVRLVRNAAGKHEIALSFTSRVAITEDRSNYSLNWREPNMPPQAYGGESTHADIAAGQTVTMRIGRLGPPLRAGVTSGTVTLVFATGPALLEGPGTVYVLVGRFSVDVP